MLSATATGAQVTPGEETALQVTLVNAGQVAYADPRNPSAASRVTTARGLKAKLLSGDAPITVESKQVGVGTLPEGAAPVQFRIDVDEDAEPGTYTVPIVVKYRYTEYISDGGNYYNEAVRERLRVSIEVREGARFEVVSAGTDAPVGGDGQVRLRLRNTGEATAEDATVQVGSSTADVRLGSGQSGTATAFVGRWAANETKRVSVDASVAPGADRRAYALDASVTYEGDDGATRQSRPARFGVVPEPEQAFDVTNASSTLRAGEEGTLSGRLVNEGPKAAGNAVLVLEPAGNNVEIAETEFAVGDLAAGAAEQFSFDLSVASAARAGPRQFTYHVRYETESGETVRSDPIYVRAEVEPERDTFDVSAVDARLEAGSSGELVLRVENTGDRELTDLSAKLFTEDPLSSGDDEAFVKTLGPGETTNVTFGLAASGSARAKTYPVSVDFQYTEPDGDTELSDTYRLAVTVTDGGGGGGGLLAIGGMSVVALAAVGIAGALRR